MSKSPEAFRSIGEVSRLVGVATHVLRYWEGQFPQLSPIKRADGRRYYRPDDIRLIAGLYQVLRVEGLSIRGAKRLIATDRGAGLREIGATRLGLDPAPDESAPDAAVETSSLTLTAKARSPKTPPRTPARTERAAAPALPLFPELESRAARPWLERLCNIAAILHGIRLKNDALPDGADALGDALRAQR